MLTAKNISLHFGDRLILDQINLSILKEERVALVGKNGAGKSSFLKILSGEDSDDGSVECSNQVKIASLFQTPQLDSDKSVIDCARLALSEQLERIKDHQHLCARLGEKLSDSEQKKVADKIDELAATIEQKGGFDPEHLIEKVLTRLGVKSREQKVGLLSGGELRRVDLARVLLMAPDIYLLDEPTNHLDFDGIDFLAEIFQKNKSTLLFISHDRVFVDQVATKIVELSRGKIFKHEPPFANYLEKKLVREIIDQKTLHRRERLLVSELSWLRAGTPARTTKQNARIDRAYELMNQVAKDQEIKHQEKVQIKKADTKRLGKTILEIKSLGASYGATKIFEKFSLNVCYGQRYGVLGPNGAGKSTLLAMISKKQTPREGEITFGKNTKVLEFDQKREVLDQNQTLKKTLADHGDYVFVGEEKIHIASYLERYLFDGSDAFRKVNSLSGGEQNRLMMAKLFREDANCLLLDEPTNDLDAESLAVLEEALLDFDGVIFVVSHDRSFLDRVCTAMIVFRNSPNESVKSDIEIYAGNYSDYQKRVLEQKKLNETNEGDKKEKPKPERVRQRKVKRSFKEEREFQQMEGAIEKLECEQKEIHEQLSDPNFIKQNPEKLSELSKRSEQVQAEIESAYLRWQELMDKGEN